MSTSEHVRADSSIRLGASRRALLRGAAWSVPTVAVAAVAPAYAASTFRYGVVFDGGGGSNGYLNSVYLNFGAAPGSGSLTLDQAIRVTIRVVGLNPNTTTERSFTAGSSDGSISRSYSAATRTTTVVWTIPVGTVLPDIGVGPTSSALPDILFTFRDGLASGQRITNKIVIDSVEGVTGNPDAGQITTAVRTDRQLAVSVPVDSSQILDYNRRAVDPDGIY